MSKPIRSPSAVIASSGFSGVQISLRCASEMRHCVGYQITLKGTGQHVSSFCAIGVMPLSDIFASASDVAAISINTDISGISVNGWLR